MAEAEEQVYMIGAAESSIVKIGYSSDVTRRLADLQRMSPVALTLLWHTPGDTALEAALHRWFRDRRTHGEWFDFTDVGDPITAVQEAVGSIARQEVGRVARVAHLRARHEAEQLRHARWTARHPEGKVPPLEPTRCSCGDLAENHDDEPPRRCRIWTSPHQDLEAAVADFNADDLTGWVECDCPGYDGR